MKIYGTPFFLPAIQVMTKFEEMVEESVKPKLFAEACTDVESDPNE